MKQCRTTDDGVHYYLIPADAPKPKTQPISRPTGTGTRERIAARFDRLRRLVESDRDLSHVWLEPEDLR